MYRHIASQLILSGISKRELAEKLGISFDSLNKKLISKSDFTLDEAIELKRLLNTNASIEMLFSCF
jgi:plasmid maintenance system antidote protein VapI